MADCKVDAESLLDIVLEGVTVMVAEECFELGLRTVMPSRCNDECV